MNELEEYVRSYFGIVKGEDIDSLVFFFNKKSIPKGNYLLKQGQRSNELAFVQSGYLRMFIQMENKEVTQWISSKGFFAVDISSFIFEKSSSSN